MLSCNSYNRKAGGRGWRLARHFESVLLTPRSWEQLWVSMSQGKGWGGSIDSEELKAFYHLLWYSCFGRRMGMRTWWGQLEKGAVVKWKNRMGNKRRKPGRAALKGPVCFQARPGLRSVKQGGWIFLSILPLIEMEVGVAPRKEAEPEIITRFFMSFSLL